MAATVPTLASAADASRADNALAYYLTQVLRVGRWSNGSHIGQIWLLLLWLRAEGGAD